MRNFLLVLVLFMLLGCEEKKGEILPVGLDKEIVYTCVDDIKNNLGQDYKDCIAAIFKNSNDYEYAKSTCSSSFRDFDVKFYECLDSKGE